MIQYDGINIISNQCYISFINEKGARVSIPIEKIIADRFTKYLGKISTSEQISSKLFQEIDNETD